MIDRDFLLRFLASLCLCSDIGDVTNVCKKAAAEGDLGVKFFDLKDLEKKLAKKGVKTLHGTAL